MDLSVIIPVLNERHHLPATLSCLAEAKLTDDILVVDGGSADGTREWLNRQSIVRVIDSTRGRGAQLNAGAQVAAGDTLLFLHADCLPPPDAHKLIADALADDCVAGGCFEVSFAERKPQSLNLIAAGINARTRLTRTATGDQGIFVRRSVYERAGGLATWPLFEDVDFVSRLKRHGRFVVLPAAVTISARRWLRNGVWRTTFLMYALRAGFYVGLSPFTLKDWFEDVREFRQPGDQLTNEGKGEISGQQTENAISKVAM